MVVKEAEKGKEAVRVRKASPEDIPEVMRINRLSLPENYTYAFFEMLLKDYPDTFLLAEVESRPVGYIMCRIERIMSKVERFRIRKAGHVISIAVLEGYRRMGIATKLMEEAMRAMRESYRCSETYLEVRVSNEPAIRLYEKLGFVKVDRIMRYYMDGEDAYVMAKPLD